VVLEKLAHCKEAEKDCICALELNPDSAKALKVRGKLRCNHLEDWHGALSDLSQAQTIDFDPDLVETLKELTKLRAEEEKEKLKDELTRKKSSKR
jgi:suppressor of tumorigenicity protein 13